MNKKKKILICLVILVIIIVVILFVLYKNGKKKIDIVLKMSKNMYQLNDGYYDNVYYRIDNESGYSEVYRYFDTTKNITYSNEKELKTTEIIQNGKSTAYLENSDSSLKIKRIKEVEEVDNLEINYDTMFSSDEENFWDIIRYGFEFKIKNEKIDGRDCYVLSDFDNNGTDYIDAESYFPVKMVNKSIDENGKEHIDTIFFVVRFNVVTESAVQFLNDDEYTLVSETEFDSYYD